MISRNVTNDLSLYRISAGFAICLKVLSIEVFYNILC